MYKDSPQIPISAILNFSIRTKRRRQMRMRRRRGRRLPSPDIFWSLNL
jgi:hypothetical protein